jgi:hypothetical protein
VGSLESRVLVSARQFRTLGVSKGPDIPELESIDRTSRALQSEDVLRRGLAEGIADGISRRIPDGVADGSSSGVSAGVADGLADGSTEGSVDGGTGGSGDGVAEGTGGARSALVPLREETPRREIAAAEGD